MFITEAELKSVMYEYQVTEITEGDTDITAMAISSAVEEIKSYLRGSYDTDTIFTATGTNRNALLMELCKNVAAWYLVRLANVDMIYSQVKERYDRAIEFLTKVADGKIAPAFPLRKDSTTEEVVTKFRNGSNEKFSHYFD